VERWCWAGVAAWVGGVEPEKPTVATTPAAHMAAIVIRRIRRGVSQGMFWLCIHVLKPLAADAAAIAHPAHMSAPA
jgi:hypothetical protein